MRARSQPGDAPGHSAVNGENRTGRTSGSAAVPPDAKAGPDPTVTGSAGPGDGYRQGVRTGADQALGNPAAAGGHLPSPHNGAVPETAEAWAARPELLVAQEPADRIALAQQLTEDNPLGHVELTDVTTRMRAAALWASAKGIDAEQLGVAGVDRARLAVIHAEQDESEDAITFANGVTELHLELIVGNDALGAAVAASRDKSELLTNLRAVAAGKFVAPEGLDAAAQRRQADSSLFQDLAHEQWHSLRQQLFPKAPETGGADAKQKWTITLENEADKWGFEVLLRSGGSPLAAAAHRLERAMRHSLRAEDPLRPSMDAQHATDLQRYTAMYEYFDARKDAKRPDGVAYMTDVMKAEFAMLPTPDEAKTLLIQIADDVRGYSLD
jgi:hypothetical protein